MLTYGGEAADGVNIIELLHHPERAHSCAETELHDEGKEEKDKVCNCRDRTIRCREEEGARKNGKVCRF